MKFTLAADKFGFLLEAETLEEHKQLNSLVAHHGEWPKSEKRELQIWSYKFNEKGYGIDEMRFAYVPVSEVATNTAAVNG